jgi:hypothetical protein
MEQKEGEVKDNNVAPNQLEVKTRSDATLISVVEPSHPSSTILRTHVHNGMLVIVETIPDDYWNISKEYLVGKTNWFVDFEDNTVTYQIADPNAIAANQTKSASADLKAEKAIKSETQRVFNCPIRGCSKVFSRKEHLQRHGRTHTGEKVISLLIISRFNVKVCGIW